jgi:rod shape-determining protein MreC
MDNLMGRYRNVTILAAAVFIQLIGLAVQIKRRTEDDSTRLIRIWTVSAVTPFEKALVRIQTGTSGVWHNYIYLRGVRQQNRDLQQQIQQMQLEQVRLREDAGQARRLQALLGFKEQFVEKTIAAQVIGSSGSEQSRLVYIDKGSDDGIKNDMPVITATGVVGKISSVINGSTSQVLLINDQNSGVGTILEQSRLQGVLKGRASGELALDKVMAEEDVKPGDRVLTSGGDQIFPKGLPVGTVAKINRGTEFQQVIVRPAAVLNHLEEVLVITQKRDREPAVNAGAPPLRAADVLAQRLPSVPDAPFTQNPGVSAPGTQAAASKVQEQVTRPAPAPAGIAGQASSASVKAQPSSSPPDAASQRPRTTVVAPPQNATPPNASAPVGTRLLPASAGVKPGTAPGVTANASALKTSGTAPQKVTTPASGNAGSHTATAPQPAAPNSKPVVPAAPAQTKGEGSNH